MEAERERRGTEEMLPGGAEDKMGCGLLTRGLR